MVLFLNRKGLRFRSDYLSERHFRDKNKNAVFILQSQKHSLNNRAGSLGFCALRQANQLKKAVLVHISSQFKHCILKGIYISCVFSFIPFVFLSQKESSRGYFQPSLCSFPMGASPISFLCLCSCLYFCIKWD